MTKGSRNSYNYNYNKKKQVQSNLVYLVVKVTGNLGRQSYGQPRSSKLRAT